VTATKARETFLSLLDEVAAGQEIEITKFGRVVAKLVAALGPPAMKASLAGVATTAATEEDLFTTVW
jgi:prevent-host-death family protein